MLPPKIKLHPLHGLRTPMASQENLPSNQDKIADLQQALDDIEESQDRTSFFLGELTLWAANLRPKA
jgi:hypothetical protein